MKSESYLTKRALLHLLHLMRLKNGTHKQSITMEDLDQLANAFKAGYPKTYDPSMILSPSTFQSLEEAFKSIKFP